MTQPPTDILLRIERLLRMGKQQEAQVLLVDYLKNNPASAHAWWLMSLTVQDLNQQKDCLERVLHLDPDNELARERLDMLSGQSARPPSVNPFTVQDMPDSTDSQDAPPVEPAWAAPPEEPAQTTDPLPGPVPFEPQAGLPVLRKPKRKWWIADILIAVLVIGMLSIFWAYIKMQQQAQEQAAQELSLQQTLDLAQSLANMQLPTLIPTWTGSPTWTALPSSTFTLTPSFTSTLKYTLTRTPHPLALEGPILGLFAPGFSLTDLASGQKVMLNQFEGQPALILFFATWCPHCNNEIAAVESIYQQYKDSGLALLAIDDAENEVAVNAFRSTHQITFPILLDPSSTALSTYRVNAVPSHFFVNSAGRLSYIAAGEMTFDQLEAQVKAILYYPPTATP